MPSIRHEIPLQLLRHRAEVAARIARIVLGLQVPDLPCWRPGPETVTLLSPGELHLDVVLIGSVTDKPEYAIIHEVQNSGCTAELERIALSWPAYVTHVRQRLGCPVVLLAFCPDERTARKVAAPIETGHPDFVFRPRTYWPGMLPAITTVAEADQWPELALLSAPGHLSDAERRTVLTMALEAMQHLEPDWRVHYHDYISRCVPERYRKEWEELVAIAIENYHWESDFAHEHQAIGRAEGRAEALAALAGSVLRVLERRGLQVDDAVRARATSCSDLDQLTRWLDLALTVDSAEQIFDRGADPLGDPD
ncbi:hypothetical protein [Nocardia seriolae]|uniref:Uncharacterized protein n=1 Tax=Nocardia seriolae TaxID=37332 RepID=A0A0B8N5G7_9NOCA|nr:hypothetical protein [Nocardia seriolae]MTJ64622.1 hypothetical protein [Nocardia seriolae]MTJ72109.1 hypothetical protein [Nocardia seriolae]MTJ89465.1 hypothetical protein [Nocardia seriolae]MTK33441.1 hypothetical protein [Nocardia seriolae]MTK42579.1 hypothetical protein [Nocardia seriolae]